MAEHRFPTPEPVELYAEIGKGHVDVTATDTAETVVEVIGRDAEHVTVRRDGSRVTVAAPRQRGLFGGDPRLDVHITIPSGSGATIRTGSADVTVRGELATGQAKSGSGDVHFDTVTGPLVVETGSGDVRVTAARDVLKVKSGAGDVVVGEASGDASLSSATGDVRIATSSAQAVVRTGSGDLEVGEACHDIAFTTGSGDLVVSRASRGRVSAKGASGDVRVGIPAGTPVWTDISTVTGEIRSNLVGTGEPAAGTDHVEVRARTVSGDVVLAEI